MHESTATVTEMPFRLEHIQACDDQAIGRQVRWLLLNFGPDMAYALGQLTEDLDDHRPENCGCARLRLGDVERRLHRARKGWDGATPAMIEGLVAQRDALRALANR